MKTNSRISSTMWAIWPLVIVVVSIAVDFVLEVLHALLCSVEVTLVLIIFVDPVIPQPIHKLTESLFGPVSLRGVLGTVLDSLDQLLKCRADGDCELVLVGHDFHPRGINRV